MLLHRVVTFSLPPRVVAESVEAARRQYPGLPHPAAESLSQSLDLPDKVPRADDHAAHGGPEALAQTDHGGVAGSQKGGDGGPVFSAIGST